MQSLPSAAAARQPERTSLRRAIDQHCKWCCYDPHSGLVSANPIRGHKNKDLARAPAAALGIHDKRIREARKVFEELLEVAL